MYLPFSHAQTPQCPNVPKVHEEAVRAKVRVVNNSQELKLIGRHEHLSQILPTRLLLPPPRLSPVCLSL